MHDIKAIRPLDSAFDVQLMRRGINGARRSILRADAAAQSLAQELINKREKENESSLRGAKFQAARKKLQEDVDKIKIDEMDSDEEYKSFIARIFDLEQEWASYVEDLELVKAVTPFLIEAEIKARAELTRQLESLPNLPAPDVPDGLDETGNVVIHTCGTPPTFAFAPKEHDALALRFGYDPDVAAAIAGARFAVLRGPLARLHRALGQFMLDANVMAGWTEIAPPVLVHERAMFGTGQLPKFADAAFQTTDGRFLIPTAEVSLTNSIRGRVLDAAELPLRLTALTPCFRSEAGSAGRDTRGLIRQHQFDKVELVAIVADADAAAAMHEEMTAQAESILDALGLPFRRMLLCAGDMGFTARKTFDLEVWLPGQGAYREISSISDCGDFQARRMDVHEPKGGRFKVRGQKGTAFVHTLNGSALAVGRTLVAVIENYQRSDGSVAVPAVLLPYMGGVSELVPG